MTRAQGRSAFTLVELLVVIAIMIVLLAIGIGVAYSGAFGSQKLHSAADRAGGWLLIAKNRAKRDNAPRGVRFFRNPANPTQVTEAQYIEQPDEWVPNPNQELNPHGLRIVANYQFQASPAVNVKLVYLVSYDPMDTPAGPANMARRSDIIEFTQRISVNDMLIAPELGGPFRITNIITPAAGSPDLRLQLHDQYDPAPLPGPLPPIYVPPENSRILVLATAPALGAAHSLPADPTAVPPRGNLGTLTTYKFAFQPAPRPLVGEPLLQLTGTTIIDWRDQVQGDGVTTPLNPYYVPGQPTTTVGVTMDPGTVAAPTYQYFDILFAPSGQVLNNASGVIVLWVRDPDKLAGHPRLPDDATGYDLAGEQLLVTIYTRTGFIATHPVSTIGGNPYLFALDGTNSGF